MAFDSTGPDVLVLRRGTHGVPASEYADSLRERLPGYDVRLARTPSEERDLIATATVASATSIDPELLDHADRLRWFACAAAGYEHLPLEQFVEMGAVVTNASGVHGPNIAEHVLGAILHFVRRFDVAHRRKERREWRHYQADELAGSTVAVVGMGAIGRAVLERLEPFGVETVGLRHTPEKGGPADRVGGYDDLPEVAADADYLVIACPLTDRTRGLVDDAVLSTLPPDAVLVNIARGPIVDTGALVDAIRGNQVGGAALDVTDPEPLPAEHPLWSFGNVLITPHNSGSTPAYYDRLADIVARNVERIESSGEWTGLENQVSP